MAMKRVDAEFTKDGKVWDPNAVNAVLDLAAEVTDLIVVSHGWNNDMAEARALYDELLGNVDLLLGEVENDPDTLDPLKPLEGRTFAACQLFWPSKKFADEQLIPGGGAASAGGANDAALMQALDRLAEDPERLGKATTPGLRKALVAQAKAIVPKLEQDASARKEFVFILRTLLDPDHASADDASEEFFSLDPETLFTHMEGDVQTVHAAGGGGAATMPDGSAAGLGDFLKGMKAAARRLANFATYYQMKGRAGTVGRTGVAALLRRVRERNPAVKLHLVGHSFGGRLVTAAAHALDDNTPDVTVSLLQAAFSHNSLSANFDNGKPGGFREVVSAHRASGPIVITHTKNDTAVGIAYPLASRIAFQNASALGDQNDPYGGMGRNGAQRTAEATTGVLEYSGHDYGFATNAVYNLLADDTIKNHGDVRGQRVAYAILSAAAAV